MEASSVAEPVFEGLWQDWRSRAFQGEAKLRGVLGGHSPHAPWIAVASDFVRDCWPSRLCEWVETPLLLRDIGWSNEELEKWEETKAIEVPEYHWVRKQSHKELSTMNSSSYPLEKLNWCCLWGLCNVFCLCPVLSFVGISARFQMRAISKNHWGNISG